MTAVIASIFFLLGLIYTSWCAAIAYTAKDLRVWDVTQVAMFAVSYCAATWIMVFG